METAMSISVHELGYLGFEVSDLPAWERFASEVLGLEVLDAPKADDGKKRRLLRMDAAAQRFILTVGRADDCAFAGWAVDDVVEFGKKLEALGVKWSGGSQDELALRGVEAMLHFRDPDGNRHEVFSGQRKASAPFVSARVASGFVTGDGGLGHAVYQAADYPAAVEFAQKVLGLRVSDYIDITVAPGVTFEVAFFHANERHHSYAVAPRPPIPGPVKHLHHFMIETRSITDVGLARDRCVAAGYPIAMDIGQHPNDRMVSFYGQTPSGVLVEFGCGGILVDDSAWTINRFSHMSEWGHKGATSPAA
jgi:2,3-dihydroxybiphenyl 1,2-dioxygenase